MRRLLLIIVMSLPLYAEAQIVSLGKFRMQVGDDPAWTSPHYDDSRWRRVEINDIREATDTIWLRRVVDVRMQARPLGLGFAALASHEVWWDGERIGAGGVVGRTAAAERPGPVDVIYQIPDRLAATGSHSLAIRLSAFHRHFVPSAGIWAVFVGDYTAMTASFARHAWLALIAMSGILVTAAFAFAMFLANGYDRRSLLLGTLGVSAAALLLAESWRALFGYSYDRHIVRLVIVTMLTWLVAVQLVALVVSRFPHRRGKATVWLTAAAAALGILVPVWDGKALVMFAVGILGALGWTIAAVRRRAQGSVLALIGIGAVAAGLVLDPLGFAESGLFFLLDVLFICLLCSHALDVRRELLRSARLELELVKRQLQPHFLMNTLTALSEWIELDPPTAVRMIDSLGEEMRILNDVASERLIRAEDEIRLCRAHLSTMELRRDVRYELIARGFSGHELVPPGTFHTLVENAVTHGTRCPHVVFELTAAREGPNVRYLFMTPFESDGSAAALQKGTGTRYIEARLREAWGERWSFAQRQEGARWRAEIVGPA
jgi:MFS family permease